MSEDKFLFSSCTLFNEKLFFIEVCTGLPALMDLKNGDVNYCNIIHGYIYRPGGDTVDYIDCHQQKIYILEQSGKNLVILDFEKNECCYKKLDCDYFPWGNFAAFEKYNSDYYIFPKYGNEILAVNTNNDEITKLATGLLGIGEPRCCCRAGNIVWILPEGKRVIGAFDLACQSMKIYKFKENIERIVDAICIDENIFFLNLFGIIYKWNTNKKQIEIIETLKTKKIEKDFVIKIIYAGNKLIVFPLYAADIKILDLSTDEMKIYRGYPSDFMYQKLEWSQYFHYCEDEFYYYFAMRSANYVLKVDKQSGEFIWLKPSIPPLETTQKVQKLFQNENVRIEFVKGKTSFSEKEFKITELIKIDFRSNENKKDLLVGSKIYEKINNSR